MVPYFDEFIFTVHEEISSMTWCWVIQSIPRIISMPSSARRIRSVLMIMLPNLIGTSRIIWLEAILPPSIQIIYDPLVWLNSNPMWAPNFGIMKLCDAPELNNITTGLWWIVNVPVMTGAPSGRSVSVVKLILPCLTWIICPLSLLSLFSPES